MTSRPIYVVVTSRTFGGAEAYLFNLYNGLGPHGFAGHLLGDLPAWPSGLPQTSLGYGPKWALRTLPRSLLSLRVEQRRAIRIAASLAQERRGRAFHMQFKREQIALSRSLASIAPIVWTEHGLLPRAGIRRMLIPAYRAAARFVRAVVCVSDQVRDELDAVLPDKGRPELVVIPNGVDLDHFSHATPVDRADARRQLGLPDGMLVAAFVGRLHRDKGIDLAVAAAAVASDTRLIIAGTGPEESRLRAAAGPNVTFLGHRRDVLTVYRAADVLLFTSTPNAGEGFGLVVLEAAAVGTPTVAVEGSGGDEIVRHIGGAIVDRDPVAIAHALRGLGSIKLDQEVLAREYNRAAWLGRHADLFERL